MEGGEGGEEVGLDDGEGGDVLVGELLALLEEDLGGRGGREGGRDENVENDEGEPLLFVRASQERREGRREGGSYLFHDRGERFQDRVLVGVLDYLNRNARESLADGHHEVEIKLEDAHPEGMREGGREGGRG